MINKVILVGNLGKDPEIRSFQDGSKVCNFSLATSERWKDKQTGEKRERTEWHTVAIFGSLVELAERYLRKGSKVYIEGQLQTRKWQDQSGADRYTTEVVLRPYRGELVMLDGKPQDTREDAPRDTRDPREEYTNASKGGAPAGGYDDMNDSIPFAPEWR